MKKFLRNTSVILLFIVLTLATANFCSAGDTIYQYSTINSLLLGNYDGELTMPMLLEKGDTGIGTFNTLDGEMVLIDGKVFRIDDRGKAKEVPKATRTPYAVAVFFKTDSILKLEGVTSLEELNRKVNEALVSDNIFYAIRIDGMFSTVRTRSVPAQKKPYPPLIDVVKKQSIFKFSKIKGTMIGIKCPAYIKGIGVPGFHWHFITEDRKAGGHVLDCSFENLPAKTGSYNNFFLQLPETSDFLDADLEKDQDKNLKKVEKNPGNG